MVQKLLHLQTGRLIVGCTVQHSLKGKEYKFRTSLAALYRSTILLAI